MHIKFSYNKISNEIRKKNPNYLLITGYALKVLKKSPKDLIVWQCLFTSLIFQYREKEVIAHTKTQNFVMNMSDDKFQTLNFYKAYSLYRQNQFEEAKNILNEMSCLPAQHLKAQLLYQSDHFVKALKCYKTMDLSRDIIGEANKCACTIKVMNLKLFRENYFKKNIHHLKNLILGLINVGRLQKARKLIKEALNNCLNLCISDSVQLKLLLALSLLKSKNFYQAYKIYEEIIEINFKDTFTELLITFNYLIIKEMRMISVFKRFYILLNFKKWIKKNRCSERRINIKIQINYLIMLMKCNQNSTSKSRIRLLKINKELKTLMLASLEAKKNSSSAIRNIKKRINRNVKNEDSKDRLKLAYSSILIKNNEHVEAIKVILSLKNLRFYPSIIKNYTKLLRFTNLKTKQIIFFEKSVLSWLKKNSLQNFTEVILVNCFFMFENCKYKEFLKMYSKILNSTKADIEMKIKLMSSLKCANETKQSFDVSQTNNLRKINPFNMLEEGCLKNNKAKKRTVQLNWKISDIFEKLRKKKIGLH